MPEPGVDAKDARHICPNCDGKGEVLDAPQRGPGTYWERCPTCGGSGTVAATAHNSVEPLMPEPDFDPIARLVQHPPDFELLAKEVYDVCTLQTLADKLRQVWNARGKADRAIIDAVADEDPFAHWAPPIRRTIQSLDR